jgi:hypothetical protein
MTKLCHLVQKVRILIGKIPNYEVPDSQLDFPNDLLDGSVGQDPEFAWL